jgi:hypothetical protein
MTLLTEFVRCTRKVRCPICGHAGWCMVSRDDPSSPSKVLCQRVESPRRWGNAGWLHQLRDDRNARGGAQ